MNKATFNTNRPKDANVVLQSTIPGVALNRLDESRKLCV